MSSTINGQTPGLREEYTGIAKFFHWTVAICVLTIIPVGLVMNYLPEGMAQNVAYTVHRSLGVLVLGLMILRLGYRLIVGWPARSRPSPRPSASRPMPFTTCSMCCCSCNPRSAGMRPRSMARRSRSSACSIFPRSPRRTSRFSKQLFAVHELMGLAIAGLLIMHIGGALYHYLIRRDGVLQRMLP